MIILGAYIAITGAASMNSIIKWMGHQFEGKAKVIETNKKAIERGFQLAKEQEVKV